MRSATTSLGARLRTAQVVRAIVVTVIVTYVAFAAVATATTVARAAAAWLVVSSVATVAWHLDRRATPRVLSGTTVIDGVLLGATVAATGAPMLLVLLAAAHLVTVTLTSSYRTGLRAAAAQATTLLLVSAAAEAGLVTAPVVSTATLWSLCAGLTAVTLTAAWAGASNERGLRRVGSDLRGLADLAAELDGSRGPDDVAARALHHVLARCPAERAALLLVDGATARPLATVGVRSADERAGRLVATSTADRTAPVEPAAVVARVRQDPAPFLLAALPTAAHDPLTAMLAGAADLVVVPLWTDGDAIGAIVLAGAGRHGRIAASTLTVLARYGDHVALTLHNAVLLERLRHLADTDPLTGLANRGTFDRSLDAEVQRNRRTDAPLSLALLDIDHFKQLNDTHGHQRGDEVLRAVAARIRAHGRAVDVVARYGGEEFAVVLPATGEDEAIAVVERLRADLSAAAPELGLTSSAGVATLKKGESAEGLLRRADQALYSAKRGGRDRTVSAAPSRGLALVSSTG